MHQLLALPLAALFLSQAACAAETPARVDVATASAPAPRSCAPVPEVAFDTPAPVARSRTLFATRIIGPASPPVADTALYRASRPGAPIDLDLKDADIANVCRLLADTGGVNIVLADDVRASVTVRLRHVAWDRALDAILRTKGFRASREGNMILVSAK